MSTSFYHINTDAKIQDSGHQQVAELDLELTLPNPEASGPSVKNCLSM